MASHYEYHHHSPYQDNMESNHDDMSAATELITLNADGNIDKSSRDAPKIVAAEMGDVQSDIDNGSIMHIERGLQQGAASTNAAHASNRQEKVPFVSIPRFVRDGEIVIIFYDACQAVLKTWGSYSLLKNHGMETRRFDQSELMKLKSIGAVNMQVRQLCSFIAEEEYRQLLLKYDESYNTNYAKYIQFSHPVDINNIKYPSTTNVQDDQSGKAQVVLADINGPSPTTTSAPYYNKDINGPSQKTAASLYKVHTFSIGKQDFISLSEMNNLFETHFERPELLTQVLLNLKVAVGKFTASELERLEIHLGVDGNLRRLYITRKDFERVLQYMSAFLDKNPPDITWVQLGVLNTSCNMQAFKESNTDLAGLGSGSTLTAATSHNPGNDVLDNVTVPTSFTSQSTNIADGHNSESSSGKEVWLGTDACHVSSGIPSVMPQTEIPSTSEITSSSGSGIRYLIRTCQVNNEVVVCIPDLHKAVIDMYGQSVQVGNFMNRLNIQTQRFSSVHLKRLKVHNILSSKATLCTYITKADAERLLKMYDMCNCCDDGSDRLQRIVWSEPIILENAVHKVTGDHHRIIDSNQVKQSNQATLKIPLFVVNYQIVVSMPDVHKAVQLLNGQSVQLQYNLEKLGIVKHKYSYTDVHQLKVLSHIKRPSLCTYITKTDVDRLLQYYVTPENKTKLELIEWQPPIAVERVVSGTTLDSISRPDVESVSADSNAADSEKSENYSISDLYKVFVGDDLESTPRTNEDDDQPRTSQSTSPLSLPPSPSRSISQPVRRTSDTSDSRNKVYSARVQLIQPNTTSHLLSPLHHHHTPDGAVNQATVDVNQTQVDACSRRASAPVLLSQTCCPTNKPIVATQSDQSDQMFSLSQIMATSSRSFYANSISVSDSKMHANSIPESSTVTAGSSVNSTSVSVGRVGQIPSVGSTYSAANFGKLSANQIIVPS